MRFIIQSQLTFDVEAENAEQAKEIAGKKMGELEKLDVVIKEARVVDKASGYFVN